MEKRVKIFESDDSSDLEELINMFLSKAKGKLHDIKFTFQEGIADTFYSALLIYTED